MRDTADEDMDWTRRPPVRRGVLAALRRLLGWRDGSPASRAYRFLARQLATDLSNRGRGAVVLLSAIIPSSSSNDTLLLLAHAVREELSSRVLLVDGTFADDGVGALLGQEGAPGLMDWLTGRNRDLSALVQPTAHPGIHLLPSGNARQVGAHAIQPRAVPDLYAELAGRFDYLLVQQRSILDDTRYLAFASQADLVLVVIEEGVTRVGDVDRALEAFRDHQVGHVRLMLCEPS